MMSEQSRPDPVLCFQHCEKDVDIVYVEPMPAVCPVCGEDTAASPTVRLPPFRVPSPFIEAAGAPWSVVVRPTDGTFLRDYHNETDLHVGVTDSKGTVYDYDSMGLHVSSQGWGQCLAVRFSGQSEWLDSWDDNLQQFSLQPQWSAARYCEESHHCYDFVLGFLLSVGLDSVYSCVTDSINFCEEMIIPQTIRAARYISLYRRLLTEGVIVQYTTAL